MWDDYTSIRAFGTLKRPIPAVPADVALHQEAARAAWGGLACVERPNCKVQAEAATVVGVPDIWHGLIHVSSRRERSPDRGRIGNSAQESLDKQGFHGYKQPGVGDLKTPSCLHPDAGSPLRTIIAKQLGT